MNPIQLAHKDFLTALLNLYTTLDALAIINPNTPLRLPSSPNGLHPPSIFNATAAHAAGYSPSAVALLATMPHLDVGAHEMFFALRPSTYPISYLGADLDEGYFEAQREMLDGELMPASAIRLTWEEGGHGIVYIYDTETSEIYHPTSPIDPAATDDRRTHARMGHVRHLLRRLSPAANKLLLPRPRPPALPSPRAPHSAIPPAPLPRPRDNFLRSRARTQQRQLLRRPRARRA